MLNIAAIKVNTLIVKSVKDTLAALLEFFFSSSSSSHIFSKAFENWRMILNKSTLLYEFFPLFKYLNTKQNIFFLFLLDDDNEVFLCK